jgi:hypothetical protein
MSFTADCTASVLAGCDLTVFYSSDKLYDMIYDKIRTIYHAFQITDSFVTNPVAPNAVHGVSIFHLKLTQGLLA